MRNENLRSIKWVTKESKSKLTDWTSILSDEELREKYNSALKERLDNDDYDQFNEYVKQAGAATKTYVNKKCPGWFQFSRDDLLHCLKNATLSYAATHPRPTTSPHRRISQGKERIAKTHQHQTLLS
jgi:hypothetical protein